MTVILLKIKFKEIILTKKINIYYFQEAIFRMIAEFSIEMMMTRSKGMLSPKC